MSSLSKACLEISNSIKGLRLSRGQSDAVAGSTTVKDALNNVRVAPSVTSTLTRAIKSATNRVKAFDRNVSTASPVVPARKPQVIVWEDDKWLQHLFLFFSPCERCLLAQVCQKWRDLLYQPRYWSTSTPVYNAKDWARDEEARRRFYVSLQQRSFESLCLFGAVDSDINDLFLHYPNSKKTLRALSLRCSNISDTGLELLMEKMVCVYRLELSGCNELTEAGLWTCLNSKLVSLSISDCINVADDSVGAMAQLLPSLYELNLQAYHVTDAALSFFSAKQSYTLSVLRLHSCWEITNHGIVNVVHSLPNLTTLSLSGCSKITDDGVELIAENLRKLRSLDLSWCPRVTDAALEYIACDLGQLDELVLDRYASYKHVTYRNSILILIVQ